MNPKRRIIPIFVPHEGCGYSCVYCDQHTVSGVTGQTETENVKGLIQTVISESVRLKDNKLENDSINDVYQPVEIAFYGGSFTAISVTRQNELLEAVSPLLSLNPLCSIRVSTRPDCIDDQIIERLRNQGVKTIEIGAQSMCHDVLSASRRGHTALDVETAAARIKEAGLELILQMMTGLPCDTAEKSIYTAKRLIGLKPDGVRIYPTVILKDTKLHEMWKLGQYKEHTTDEAVALCAVIVPLFEAAGIPVIRLGLNPSEVLTSGQAAAGAYHPAFGELVYSRIYYELAAGLLKDVPPGCDIELVVAKGNISKMTGNRRHNIKKLMKTFSLRSLKVTEAELTPGEKIILK